MDKNIVHNSSLIDGLNRLLHDELDSIRHYLAYSAFLSSRGYAKLSAHIEKEIADEQRHAKDLILRIIFLGSLPVFATMNSFSIPSNPRDILKSMLEMEGKAMREYRKYTKLADDCCDYGTSSLLSGVLIDEEGHYDWLRKQIDLMSFLGDEQYLLRELQD